VKEKALPLQYVRTGIGNALVMVISIFVQDPNAKMTPDYFNVRMESFA
jgi:hypothetical protein